MARTGPNVLLVVLDSVRAKSVPLAESTSDRLPHLTDLAANGVVYENAIAPSAWTLPSHASMFTGDLPSGHLAIGPDDYFEPSGSLPDRLSQAGYRTIGFSANPFVGERNGFATAFDEFRHVVPTPTTRPFAGGRDALAVARSTDTTGISKVRAVLGEVLTGRAPFRTAGNLARYKLSQRRLQARREAQHLSGATEITTGLCEAIQSVETPFFAFANYMEAHRPYEAPAEYLADTLPDDVDLDPAAVELDPWAHILGIQTHSAAELRVARAKYEAAIAYLDAQIGQLLEALEVAGIRSNTRIIVTSDHGEAFGERGRLDHNCLYQPVTRVPLVVGGREVEPDRIQRPVSLRGLYGSILDEAGVARGDEPSLEDDRSTDDPVVSQYLELHTKNLERRFDADRVRPYRERVQSAFGDDFQLVAGDRGMEELVPLDGSVDPIDGNEDVRTRLRDSLPPFPDRSEPRNDAVGGPDEELLRSLGYIE